MNADLESRIRLPDPTRGRHLSTDDESTLGRILSESVGEQLVPVKDLGVPRAAVSTTRRGHPARWIAAVAATLALIATVAALGIPGLGQPQAVAGIVPALVATPTDQDRGEVLDDLLEKARSTDDPAGYHPRAYSMKSMHESWVPGVSNEESYSFSPVSERDVVSTRTEDGTFTSTVTHLGTISARSGERIADVSMDTGERIEPGTVRSYDVEGHVAPIPNTAAGLDESTRRSSREGMAQYTGNEDLALFEVLGLAMQGWNPSQAQSAAVLELIRDRPDITFDGQAKDRMGRPGLMFSTVGGYHPGDDGTHYTYRFSFIFDPETGHLNAYEQVAGEDIDYFVPGGTLHSVTVAPPPAQP